MITRWHLFEAQEPGRGEVLLVYGPLGIDLAMNLDNTLYFKKGDNWNPENLECWSANRPTHWAKITLPEDSAGHGTIARLPSGEPLFNDDFLATLFMVPVV